MLPKALLQDHCFPPYIHNYLEAWIFLYHWNIARLRNIIYVQSFVHLFIFPVLFFVGIGMATLLILLPLVWSVSHLFQSHALFSHHLWITASRSFLGLNHGLGLREADFHHICPTFSRKPWESTNTLPLTPYLKTFSREAEKWDSLITGTHPLSLLKKKKIYQFHRLPIEMLCPIFLHSVEPYSTNFIQGMQHRWQTSSHLACCYKDFYLSFLHGLFSLTAGVHQHARLHL